MLDIEVVVPPAHDGLNILTVESLKQRLRITHSRHDDLLGDCIIEAAAKLHGPEGELNRTLFPTTYKRWLSKFPDKKDSRGNVCAIGRGVIPLPFPNLIRVVEIAIEDGSSPTDAVDPSDYVVRTGTLVGEIELKTGSSWPSYTAGPRALSITYQAGYANGYPAALKRFVAIQAAHNYLNPSSTINEARVLMLNRRTEFGVADLRRQFTVPASYDDWGE